MSNNNTGLPPNDLNRAQPQDRPSLNETSYRVRIADETLNFKTVFFDDPKPLGRQIADAVGASPAEEFGVSAVLRNGDFEDVRPDETFDLATRGSEKFIVVRSDRSFRLTIESADVSWAKPVISGKILKRLAKLPEEYDLFQDVRGGSLPDRLIKDDDLINLDDPGVERFYKKFREPEKIDIFVNGRAKSVDAGKICFDDLIALAFQTPSQGQQICFTITYRKGCSAMAEGSLIEGQCVNVTKGMVFNVTSTDKS